MRMARGDGRPARATEKDERSKRRRDEEQQSGETKSKKTEEG